MRKTLEFTAKNGRDSGKVFRITEMSATRAEKWAIRALMLLGKSKIELPENPAELSFSAIAALGFRALLTGPSFDDIEPLLDEMFECVKIIPDSSNPSIVRALVENDIEEISTRMELRVAIFNLHADFFVSAAS